MHQTSYDVRDLELARSEPRFQDLRVRLRAGPRGDSTTLEDEILDGRPLLGHDHPGHDRQDGDRRGGDPEGELEAQMSSKHVEEAEHLQNLLL